MGVAQGHRMVFYSLPIIPRLDARKGGKQTSHDGSVGKKEKDTVGKIGLET